MLPAEEATQIRRKRKTKNQRKDQKSYTYLARGAAFFWELGAPWGPPEAPGAVGRTPVSPADGAGTSTAVSACDASTKQPASAPDTGRGSTGLSGATGCGGTSDPPPDAFSPSWGPAGTEPSRGAPSSSSTIMWGTAWPPPELGTPRGPPTPLGPSTPPGSRSPRRQGGSRRPPPLPARRASERCLLHPLSPRLMS